MWTPQALWMVAYMLIVGVSMFVLDLSDAVSGILLGSMVIVGLSSSLLEGTDDRRLLAALPVNRAQVVNAWWLVAGIALATFLGLVVMEELGKRGSVGQAELWMVLEIAGGAVAFPVFMALAVRGPRRYLLWLAYLVVSVVPVALLSFIGPVRHWLVSDSPLRWALLAPAALVIVVSWWLSHRIYARQDH
ncbi:Uncharacterised protein [Actinomyces howellii]|uniref:ABC-2 family transporter protein n=1 Tax=Actinomyces howellii TaxID=52771 RepID=A0A3S4RXI9_9ACTO|nr:Uncharacterised protein [Actinomyces howellii]